MARKIWRQIDAFTPVEGQTIRRRLPLGITAIRYLCRLTGTLTVGVAACTAVLEDSPLGFIRSVDLVLNGSFPLRSKDARGLYFLDRVMYGTPPTLTPPSGAVGATAFVAELMVDLGQPDLVPPFDSAFWMDTRLLSSLELVFTFGIGTAAAGIDTDIADSAATTTQVLSALTMTIFAEEAADVGGATSRMQISRMQQQITATGDMDIALPPLGPIYRMIALHFTNHATFTDPLRQTSNDAILNAVSVIADGSTRHLDSVPYLSLRAENKLHYALEAMPAGWCVLDFAKSKTLRDLLVTRGTRTLTLRLNIASVPANSFVQIYPINALLVVAQGNPISGGRRGWYVDPSGRRRIPGQPGVELL